MTTLEDIQRQQQENIRSLYLPKTTFEGPLFLIGIGAIAFITIYIFTKTRKHGKRTNGR